MKNFLSLLIVLLSTFITIAQSKSNEINVFINLNKVNNDRLLVTVSTPKIKTDKTTYFIPKIIPGTYSTDDYGRFIENFKAYDSGGKELLIAKNDENSWTINNAKSLSKITYYVNDTFDVEDTHSIFSPAGTNIDEGKNFMLNLHGFVGYFSNLKETTYNLSIEKPSTLYGATALIDIDKSDLKDVFTVKRYADLVDNPIMYSKPDFTTFMVDDMEIIISVYSPNGTYTAKSITKDMEMMIKAQKKFLGSINNTKKYAILLYLTDFEKKDANGFGALEHSTSTVVIFPEAMPKDQLVQNLIDVVSHEFFHIVTPLSVHSNEIHYFDYNNPKMSKHLWMYEGVTEYFANLFQANQGLITDQDFYNRMSAKIENAKNYDDTMPFTKMSAEVLNKPFKDAYLNVYEKGTLIAMCLDIQIRESSNGKRGILDLMKYLSVEFGMNKPFSDDEIFDVIVKYTYPEIKTFFDLYVSNETPIPYEEYFKKVGIEKTTISVPGNVFIKGQTPYITVDQASKDIIILPGIDDNAFMIGLNLKPGDIIIAVNNTNYNLDNIYDLIMTSMSWKQDEAIEIKIKRDATEITLKGKVIIPTEDKEGLHFINKNKASLAESWLRG